MIARAQPRSVAAPQAAAKARYGWIFGVRPDLLISLCWIPVFLAAHALTTGRGTSNDHLLNLLFNGAFLASLLHQPLTLALVYGDKNQFALRKRLFTWSPVVGVALITVAVVLNLWIIIPIAAIWNTIHTLQQRYGLSRIYARKAAYGSARLDRAVLFAWMAAALVVVGSLPKTLAQLSRVMLDGRNSKAVIDLTGVRPYAVWLVIPALMVAAGLALALVRQERQHVAEANRAKWLYQGSSLALIAVIAWDPLAGFIAYVAAHAIEYAVVVYKTMQSRYGKAPDRSSLLGRVAASPRGRIGFFVVFLGGFLLLDAQVGSAIPGTAYSIVIYSVGMLHFWYDSFIWKLRKPAVAANFGIPAPARQPAPAG